MTNAGIANNLVKLMGGDGIDLESDEGKGAEFSFALPFKVCQTENSLKKAFKRLQISIISDDQTRNREKSLCRYLDAFNIRYQLCDKQTAPNDESAKVLIVLSEQQYASFSNLNPALTIFMFRPTFNIDALSNAVSIEDFESNHSRLYNLLLEFILSNHKTRLENGLDQFTGRVLLAEDHEVNQKLMDAILKKLGVEYDLAVDGAQAIEQFAPNRYDLILMDVNMPVMDGIEAMKQIKAMQSDMPIYALTANVLAEDIENYYQQGFDGHLAKPLKMDKLKEVLIKHLVD